MTRKKLENVILCAAATVIVLLVDNAWVDSITVGIATAWAFNQGKQERQ
jgi:hypothetical protein